MNQSFEERFDEKFVKKLAPHNGDGDAWPGEEGCDYYDSLINSDDEGKVQEIKAFIRQEKELSRKEGYEEGYKVGRESIFSQGGVTYLNDKSI